MEAIARLIVAVLKALATALPELSARIVAQWGAGADMLKEELDALNKERDRLREEVRRLSAELESAREALRDRESTADFLDRLGGAS